MPLYVVTLVQERRAIYTATLEVEAKNKAEATQKALQIHAEGDVDMEPTNWGFDGDDEPVEAFARRAEKA